MAELMLKGVNSVVAILVALAIGGACGLASGLLIVSRIRMPPFISTLAMMSIARGASLVITGGIPIYGLPQDFFFIGMGYWLGIPVPIVIMFIVFLLGHFDLTWTRTGIYYFAVGGHEEAARLAGIDVKLTKLRAYILSGITSAVAGVVLAARLTAVEPLAGLGYELDAIAAAVIGGVSITGGEGSLIGTAIGALIMGVLRNGLNLLNVSTYWQQVVIGVVIAATVSLAATKKK
jgi:ribose transport system permease protein